ncbi:Chromatin structure-remodeling complex protein SYD [Carex littledalei]|uniref:Chromatin structure-remodeling complex protein SYD n=1 Tax=Carex littledalei TaxID=544730 RepID=A0A833QJ18_9POAL|nr:Chromatin structure-remodeling complex protein SYD [Carex littledalei]
MERLIQESKDDPPKLATKLCLICHHMKMKGKENTLPFRVISRYISLHSLPGSADLQFPLGF